MADGLGRRIRGSNWLLVLALAGGPLYSCASEQALAQGVKLQHRFAFVVSGSSFSEQAPAFPAIPQVDIRAFPPETETQVQQAYDAARAHPKDANAVGKLGMLLSLYKRPEAAKMCFRRAHELDPRSFQWLYFWGYLAFGEKRYKEAVTVLNSALQLRPEYLAARLKLGEALLGAGKVDEAAGVYEAILKEYPDTAEACYGLGRVHMARGDLAAAVKFYRQACKLFPTYGAAHYALAMAYRKLGQRAKAEEEVAIHQRNQNIVPPVVDPLRDELRALDVSAVTHLDRGVNLEQVGRVEEAIAETEKALQLDPTLVKAHLNLLILYARLGNAKKAEEHYQAVLALNPDQFPDAHYSYGVMLMGRGRYAEAEEAFRRTLRASPTHAPAHNNLGYLLERQGKLTDALAEYRKALESDPNYRQAHFNLGRVLVNQQDYKEGIEQLSQTLTPEDENTPAYLYALGAAYGRAGDRQNALRYLHQARKQGVTRGQAKLVADIEEDLRTLEGQGSPQ
jgi:tetratricopeptide (TPR) repeat protein